jgi:hypothetical protein
MADNKPGSSLTCVASLFRFLVGPRLVRALVGSLSLMHAGVLQNRLFFSRFTSLQGPFQDGFFLHGNHLRDTLPMVASSTLSFTKHTFTSLCQTSA